MTPAPHTRRRWPLVVMALGLVVTAGAILALLGLPADSAGDYRSVEEALRAESNGATPIPTGSVASPTPSDAAESSPTPRWQPFLNRTADTDVETRAPVALRIESIGLDAVINPYGVDDDTGQMAVPDNVREVAWYRHGSSPGQSGSAVLAAHVDLYDQGPGVFFYLRDLNPGDLIHVEFQDGSEQAFVVRGRVSYSKETLPLDVIFSEQGPPVLTLVTCGGAFDSSTSRYDSNVVVYASPVADISNALPADP